LDLPAVTDISAALNAVTTSGSGSTSAPTEGDFVRIAKSTNELNLGDTITDIFSSTIDSDELPEVLADGLYSNDNNEEFEYTQELDFASLELTHFQDNDFNNEEPVIGFDIADGSAILNYTLEFTPDDAEGGVAWSAASNYFEGTTIEMLGKAWYILEVDGTTNGVEMDLLDSAASATVYEGESVTLNAGGVTYEVSIGYIDADEVNLIVNGEQTNTLNEDETQRLADGSYLGVRDIGFQGFAGGIGLVEFSIGSGKLELVNGDEITINGDQISDVSDFVVKSYFVNTTQDLESVTFEWVTDDDMWVAPGTDLVLPGLGAIKLQMTDFEVPLTEDTILTYDGDDSIKIETEVTDGDVDFNILYANDTGFIGLGQDANTLLVTTAQSWIVLDEDTLEWVVASWVNGDDYETYVLKIDSIDDSEPAKNTTTLSSVASGSSRSIALDIGETEELGELSFRLNSAVEGTGVINMTINSSSGSGTAEWDVLYTAEGLKLQLPVEGIAGTTASIGGLVNVTGGQASWVAQFVEEDDDGNVASGGRFNATVSVSSAETTVGSITVTDYETSDGSDDFEGYVESALATRTLYRTGGDQDDLLIEYHGDESFGNVYVSQAGTGSGVGAGGLSVMDSELVSSGMSTKNLVVVGGTCVNSVAADLLGVADSTCGSAWTTATGTGAGEYVIQTFANPWSGSKVATLVAGWAQADTANAATYLTTQEPTTDVGVKYTGTAGTSATMVAG
jgi:hypothetical protein